MIVVKIELWPFGDEAAAKEIGRMYVANDGAGTRTTGDYHVAVCRRGTAEVPLEIYGDDCRPQALERRKNAPKAARAGRVEGYPRLALNVWCLIARSILAAFPEEDKPAKKRRAVFDSLTAKGFQLLARPMLAALRAENAVLGLPEGEAGDALRAALEWTTAIDIASVG